MKTGAITFPLVISFLLVAIAASGVAGANDAVLDIKGNPVKANTSYTIRYKKGSTTSWVHRKVVELGDGVFDDVFQCPDRIEMRIEPTLLIFPTKTILLPTKNDTVVRIDTSLNIKFKTKTYCGSSGVWRLRNYTETAQEISPTGSLLGKDSTFTIKKFGNSTYKFVFGKAKEIDLGEKRLNHWGLLLTKNATYGVTFHPIPTVL